MDLSDLLEKLHRIEWRKARVWKGSVIFNMPLEEGLVVQVSNELGIHSSFQE